ncbi:MAG: ABC transporter ATP-binding protein [Bacteroidota bacterium]|jgi:ATP-binding cassette subfamily B multidrug efflux pump|nr:ABC transporter ATP-binding protein [Sphingobacteriia bacterium]
MPVKFKIQGHLIRRIVAYTKPYRWLFYGAMAITLVLSGMSIARPLFINAAIQSVTDQQNQMHAFYVWCNLILFSLITESALQIVNLRMTSILGQRIVRDLRNSVFQHLLHRKHAYFDKNTVGTMVTRAVSDIESINDMFSQGFIVIAGDILTICIFIGVMLAVNPLLALIAMSTIPLLFIATALFKRGVKSSFSQVRTAVASLNTFIQEHINGMAVVQLFNRQQAEYKKFITINAEHRKAHIRSILYYSVFFPVVEILISISIALVLWTAGLKHNSWHLGLGELTFFIMMVQLMFRPIRILADRLNALQMGFVSAERIFSVLDNTESMEDSGTINFNGLTTAIEFKNVFFAYKPDEPVIKGISVYFEKGKTHAIVGQTGSGKSTIAALMARFYDPDSGSITFDGVPLTQYRMSHIRRKTALVLQEVHLLNDTIFNNISLRNSEISRAQVLKGIQELHLDTFISSFEGGLDYKVQERGQSLSSGQRQLIAFIRAYIFNPDIFILDEATATLDSYTEQYIQTALQTLLKNRTCILIAHRLSTIKHAHCIYVMHSGQIQEQGSFNTLMALQSHFYTMYNTQ